MGVTENRGPANCGTSDPRFCRPLRGVTLSMEDAGKDATRFTAHSLPSDPRLLATVTNAYLGTRVYHETLHVSGVYNGALGDTHRAILPSPLNVQLEAPAGTGEQLTKTYVLDTNTGSHCLPSAHPLPQPPPPCHCSKQAEDKTEVPSWHLLTQDAGAWQKEALRGCFVRLQPAGPPERAGARRPPCSCCFPNRTAGAWR